MEWARRAEDPPPNIDCSSGGKRERRRVTSRNSLAVYERS